MNRDMPTKIYCIDIAAKDSDETVKAFYEVLRFGVNSKKSACIYPKIIKVLVAEL